MTDLNASLQSLQHQRAQLAHENARLLADVARMRSMMLTVTDSPDSAQPFDTRYGALRVTDAHNDSVELPSAAGSDARRRTAWSTDASARIPHRPQDAAPRAALRALVTSSDDAIQHGLQSAARSADAVAWTLPTEMHGNDVSTRAQRTSIRSRSRQRGGANDTSRRDAASPPPVRAVSHSRAEDVADASPARAPAHSSSLHAKVRVLQDELDGTRAKLSKASARCGALLQRCDYLQSALAKAHDEAERARAELREAQRLRQEAELAVTALQEQRITMDMQSSALHAERSELQRQRDDARLEAAALRDACALARAELTHGLERETALQHKNAALEKELAMLRASSTGVTSATSSPPSLPKSAPPPQAITAQWVDAAAPKESLVRAVPMSPQATDVEEAAPNTSSVSRQHVSPENPTPRPDAATVVHTSVTRSARPFVPNESVEPSKSAVLRSVASPSLPDASTHSNAASVTRAVSTPAATSSHAIRAAYSGGASTSGTRLRPDASSVRGDDSVSVTDWAERANVPPNYDGHTDTRSYAGSEDDADAVAQVEAELAQLREENARLLAAVAKAEAARSEHVEKAVHRFVAARASTTSSVSSVPHTGADTWPDYLSDTFAQDDAEFTSLAQPRGALTTRVHAEDSFITDIDTDGLPHPTAAAGHGQRAIAGGR